MRNIEHLQHREFLTPKEASVLLGRSDEYWRGLVDRGLVSGYRETTRRYVRASSARAYLDGLCAKQPQASGVDRQRAKTRAAVRSFQARMKALGVEPNG
jgi:hypothetical protein